MKNKNVNHHKVMKNKSINLNIPREVPKIKDSEIKQANKIISYLDVLDETFLHQRKPAINNHKMIIEVKLIDGQVKITNIENVKQASELPQEYIKGVPCFYKENNYVIYSLFTLNPILIEGIINSKSSSLLIKEGCIFSKNTFDAIIKVIHECGDRLHKINKDLKSKDNIIRYEI